MIYILHLHARIWLRHFLFLFCSHLTKKPTFFCAILGTFFLQNFIFYALFGLWKKIIGKKSKRKEREKKENKLKVCWFLSCLVRKKSEKKKAKYIYIYISCIKNKNRHKQEYLSNLCLKIIFLPFFLNKIWEEEFIRGSPTPFIWSHTLFSFCFFYKKKNKQWLFLKTFSTTLRFFLFFRTK